MKPEESINKPDNEKNILNMNIDKRVLSDMDIAISNYKKGVVSQAIDLSDF